MSYSCQSVDHLLLHFSFACRMWFFVFSVIGIDWVMLENMIDDYACWRGLYG